MNIQHAKLRCQKYRRKILDISQKVGALHIAPAFSCLEITDVIYNELMVKDEEGKFIDTFIMSKGHGCMSQYVILNEIGYLLDDDINNYCTPKGRLGAHPDYGLPGISASTGSLGHGLGMAVGLALSKKLQKLKGHLYLVLSDGELQEGSTWEAILMAANLKLNNLTVFLDLNDFSGLVRMSEAHKAFYPIDQKLKAFGWNFIEVDGHNSAELFRAAQTEKFDRPLFVSCKTIKGKGVSFMESAPIWHYRSPNISEYEQAKKELEEFVL